MSDLSNLPIVDRILAVRYDPSRMVDVAMDVLDQAMNGEIDIPDEHGQHADYARHHLRILSGAG